MASKPKVGFWRFVMWSALGGLCMCVVLVTINLLDVFGLGRSYIFDYVTVMLWPTSLAMMATEGYEPLDLFYLAALGYSFGTNILIYSFLGGILWCGLYKTKWALLVIPLIAGISWYQLI